MDNGESRGWLADGLNSVVREVKRTVSDAVNGAQVDVSLRARGGSSANVQLGKRPLPWGWIAAAVAGTYLVTRK